MKDLPMFNKLFFALCSTLMIALSSPSAGEELRRLLLFGAASNYEIYGTEGDRRNLQKVLDRAGDGDFLTRKLVHERAQERAAGGCLDRHACIVDGRIEASTREVLNMELGVLNNLIEHGHGLIKSKIISSMPLNEMEMSEYDEHFNTRQRERIKN